MATETTVLDFNLGILFTTSALHINAPKQDRIKKKLSVKTFYIGDVLENLKEQLSNTWTMNA